MTAEGAPTLRLPVSDDDWSRGPTDAPVTVVEYADFQCPACQAAHSVMDRLLEGLTPQVRFVFRHFPIASLHPQAEKAAFAAEAAGRQGKFWEMQRRLFEAKGALADDDLERYARQLGLDLDRFQRDMHDPALPGKIGDQKLAGVRSGVNGTPTLYINGARFDGSALDCAALKAAILTASKKSAR